MSLVTVYNKNINKNNNNIIINNVNHDNNNNEDYTPQPRFLTNEQKSLLIKAREFALSIQTKLQLSTQILVDSDIVGTDIRTLAVISRIYVGSINFELSETHLQTVFGQFGMVKNIALSIDHITGRHRGYGFIEFDTPEASELALQTLNGAELAGRILKIGRPNNFQMALDASGLTPPKERIYISNIPEQILEDHIKRIFEPFGQIKKAILLPNPLTRKHQGYGFIEYSNASSASSAKLAMNGFDLGGNMIRIGDAMVSGPLGEGMKMLEGLPKQFSPGSYQSVDFKENDNSLNLNNSIKESLVVLIQNAAEAHEAGEELKQEFILECEKFGSVNQLIFHSPNDYQLPNSDLKIFVQYNQIEDSKNAKLKLDQRWFGGKQINVSFFDSLKFENGDFS